MDFVLGAHGEPIEYSMIYGSKGSMKPAKQRKR